MIGWGGLVGWLFGCGAAAVVAYDGPWRAVRLHQRIRAAVHDADVRVRVASGPLHLLGATRVRAIETRQLHAGEAPDAAAHVLRSLISAVAGLAVGTVVIAVLAASQQVRNPVGAVVLLGMAVLSGWLVADYRLGVRVRRCQQRATVALPAFVESIALAVAAGAGLPQALGIVGQNAQSVLGPALREAMTAVDGGGSLDVVLRRFADRFPSPAMQRLVAALLIAIERGTPIADVLHAQAIDARQETRRELLENAGRREVSMLIPVIFLVLPAVVVIALYPGLHELTSLAT